MSDEQDGGTILFPFTCVESVGGPYQDRSFMAGFMMGRAYEIMFTYHEDWVEKTMICQEEAFEQLDLIAMNFGLVTIPQKIEGGVVWFLVRKKNRSYDL